MAARHRTAVRQLQRPFPGARDPRFFQPLGDLLTPHLATRFLFIEQSGHRRMVDIDIQPDNMNFMIFPQRGNFHPGYQRQR